MGIIYKTLEELKDIGIYKIEGRGWEGLPQMSKDIYKETYFLQGETYEQWLLRVSKAYAKNEQHRNLIEILIHNYWFHPSTPPSGNAGTDKGLPISCYVGEVPDNKKGIFGAWIESGWLGSFAGGIGRDWSNVRELGAKVGVDGESSGVIPFMQVDNALTNAISQGNLRRMSQADYLRIDHPEILEFIDIRKPMGDSKRKALDLHHGVTITDKFMDAVIKDEDFDLISPKTKEVVNSVSARTLWHSILERRITTGEPYLLFIDTVNRMKPEEYVKAGYNIKLSNLCVSGDTKLLTDRGYVEIEKLAGTNQTVWNGFEWSPNTEVFRTDDGKGQAVMSVHLEDYTTIKATPYHRWLVKGEGSTVIEKRTSELKAGDKIAKHNLEVVTHGNKTHDLAYESGLFTAEGTYEAYNRARLYLYSNKKDLLPYLKGYYNKYEGRLSYTPETRLQLSYYANQLFDKFYVPSAEYTIQTRLSWLAGFLDGDGTLTNNGGTEAIQVVSINLSFLQEIKLMLSELGVHSTIVKGYDEGYRLMPKNDGSGESREYFTQASYRLLIAGSQLGQLLSLGFKGHRVMPMDRMYNRDARRFVKVAEVENLGEIVPTYCAREPKNNTLILNGHLTMNCSEIMLNTEEDKTNICCLASFNLEYWDEYSKHIQLLVSGASDYLDGIVQDFIDRTEHLEGFEKARKGAIEERALGLGVMGWHSLLQRKHIPFESALAQGLNKTIFQAIYEASEEHQRIVNDPCPLAKKVGSHRRNITTTAVAPTMSISNLCNMTSSGIEPIQSNIFIKKLKQGSFSIINKYLQRYLEKYRGQNNLPYSWVEEQLQIIKKAEGSVQALDWVDDYTKDVFKTAFEIDQRWVIELASDRTKYINQGQSLNLFIEGNSWVDTIADLHILAWAKDVKSLYYTRSRNPNRANTSSRKREVIEIDYNECLSCT